MTTVRYGLLGCGMMGKEHIRNLKLIDGAVVSAVADPDGHMQQENQALAPEARFCASLDELLSGDDIDVLLIASPNYQHCEQLLHVLSSTTLPVIVEKPLCTRYEDIARLAKAFEAHPAPVWVAMEYRYMPPVQLFRSRLSEGVVGDVQMLSIIEHRFPFLEKVGDWNRFNEYSGGTLVEKCCHYFDLMRLLVSSTPCRVYASGAVDHNHKDESYSGRVPDIIDNAYVIVDFKNGQRAMLELCMFAEGSRYQESIIALGPLAKLECDIPGPTRFWKSTDEAPPKPRVVVSPREPFGPQETEVPVNEALLAAGDHNGSTYYQHCEFFKAVCAYRGDTVDDSAFIDVALDIPRTPRSGACSTGLEDPELPVNRGVAVTGLDGLRAVLLGMAAQHSIESRQAVSIADDGLSFTP